MANMTFGTQIEMFGTHAQVSEGVFLSVLQVSDSFRGTQGFAPKRMSSLNTCLSSLLLKRVCQTCSKQVTSGALGGSECFVSVCVCSWGAWGKTGLPVKQKPAKRSVLKLNQPTTRCQTCCRWLVPSLQVVSFNYLEPKSVAAALLQNPRPD